MHTTHFEPTLQILGIGRGEGYQPLSLDEPAWSNVAILGDKVLWSEVQPGVDVSVRCIHDILKVDVKVKQKLRDELPNMAYQGV